MVSLGFFTGRLTLDTQTGKRLYLQPGKGNGFGALQAESVFSIVNTLQA